MGSVFSFEPHELDINATAANAITTIFLFIRKVIISEPPFEAVQFNIQYLQTDKRIAGTWVELAAYRKA